MEDTSTQTQAPHEDEAIDIDALYQAEVDEEKEKEVQRDLLLGEGNWFTVPEVKVTVERKGKESKTPGRIVARCFAQVQREKEGQTEKGAVSFRLSHEPLKNDKGKWDAPTRLYLAAKAAMLRSGMDYQGPGSVYAFIRDYPVKLRVIKLDGNEEFPDPSNFVTTIQKAPGGDA